MIYKNDCTLTKEYLEKLAEQGLDGLPDLVSVLVNQECFTSHGTGFKLFRYGNRKG